MQQIGRYQIQGELGRGAMGVVYKARDPKIGRDVAIKTIRIAEKADPSEQQKLRERLFREAQSAGILSHPGIVTIYDISEENGMAYIAMEFVEGMTLESLIQQGQAGGLQFLSDLVEQAAGALDYAHGKGIIHRDIKPANIIVRPDGQIKITDFGIARIMSSKYTQTGVVVGTPSYMSPEQVQGADVIDGRADQFSLAVIAFELATNHKPFKGDNLTTLIFQIVSAKPPAPRQLNPQVTHELDAVLLRALAKRPDDRFANCAEFAQTVRSACANLSTDEVRVAPPTAPSARSETDETAEDLHAKTASSAVATADTAVEGPPAELSQTLPPLGATEASALLDDEEPPKKRRWGTALVALLAIAAGALAWAVIQYPWLRDDPIGLWNAVQPEIFASGPVPSDPHQIALGGLPEPSAPAIRRIPLASAPPPGAGTPPPEETSETAPDAPPDVADTGSQPSAPPPARPLNAPQPTGPKQEIAFASNQAGTEVRVLGNDDWVCTTPCRLELPPGTYEAYARAGGFETQRRSFQVADSTGTVAFSLAPVLGTLLIASEPDGANIWIDGKPHSQQTNARLRLPPGYYVVRVASESGGSVEQSVRVEPDSLQSINASLGGGRTRPGELDLSSLPPGTNVKLNGHQAIEPGTKSATVVPGLYYVELSLPGGRKATQELRVLSGGKTLVTVP